MAAYRGDIEALKYRKEQLERELVEVRARAAELSALGAREVDLKRQLDEVRQNLEGHARRAKTSLPLALDQVRIASPCSARWDDMVGDDQVRFCGHCEKNVYNLSAMTREQAEALLREREGDVCARLYRRSDGTVITADCPVGARKKRVRRIAAVAAGTGLFAMAASFAATERHETTEHVAMGAIASPITPVTPTDEGKVTLDRQPETQPVAPPAPPAPKNPTHGKPHHLMGRIVSGSEM